MGCNRLLTTYLPTYLPLGGSVIYAIKGKAVCLPTRLQFGHQHAIVTLVHTDQRRKKRSPTLLNGNPGLFFFSNCFLPSFPVIVGRFGSHEPTRRNAKT